MTNNNTKYQALNTTEERNQENIPIIENLRNEENSVERRQR